MYFTHCTGRQQISPFLISHPNRFRSADSGDSYELRCNCHRQLLYSDSLRGAPPPGEAIGRCRASATSTNFPLCWVGRANQYIVKGIIYHFPENRKWDTKISHFPGCYFSLHAVQWGMTHPPPRKNGNCPPVSERKPINWCLTIRYRRGG